MEQESIGHETLTVIEKYKEDIYQWLEKNPDKSDNDFSSEFVPYERREIHGNILASVGAELIWQATLGIGSPTLFNSTNSRIGVGDSGTSAVSSQTDLQGTNKIRKAMVASYPTISTQHVASFKASFGPTEANFVWNEWAIFNAASGGTMLNRKVASLGTKSGGTWILTVTVGIT